MNTCVPRTDLPPALVSELVEILQRIRIVNSAIRLWETKFNEAERTALGKEFPLAKLDEAYAKFRNVSRERAVVELGAAADHITPATRDRLLQQLGEIEAPSLQSAGKPQFDMETGRLFFDGKLLAKFQVRREATNPCRVLEAFQRSGWVQSIENPLRAAPHVETSIYKVVQQLHSRINTIRFQVNSSGNQISWHQESVSQVSVN